jgi:hypothetical protein
MVGLLLQTSPFCDALLQDCITVNNQPQISWE